MSVFSVNMEHSVESCPLFNVEVMKSFKAVVSRREEAAKKHMVRVLSAWSSVLDHLIFWIVEAPSQKAVEDYFTEIGFAFWNKLEIRQVRLVENIIKTIEKS